MARDTSFARTRMATDSETISTSMVLKNLLVCFHERRCPVSFLARSSITEERHAFFEAIKETFGDVFTIKI